MELTEVQQIGLIAMMAGFAQKGVVADTLHEAGLSLAGTWLQLNEEGKEEMRVEADKGIALFKEAFPERVATNEN